MITGIVLTLTVLGVLIAAAYAVGAYLAKVHHNDRGTWWLR